jgi:hypothetical protein
LYSHGSRLAAQARSGRGTACRSLETPAERTGAVTRTLGMLRVAYGARRLLTGPACATSRLAEVPTVWVKAPVIPGVVGGCVSKAETEVKAGFVDGNNTHPYVVSIQGVEAILSPLMPGYRAQPSSCQGIVVRPALVESVGEVPSKGCGCYSELFLLVFCPRDGLTHRGGRGARHARREEGAYPLADIQPTSNAAGRDASVPECRRISGTGH